MQQALRAPLPALAGKVGLVTGLGDDRGLAWRVGRACHAAGADIAFAYRDARARRTAEPLARSLGARVLVPCDFAQPGAPEAVFETLAQIHGRIDFVVHVTPAALPDDVPGRVADCPLGDFQQALELHVHAFARLAGLAAPLMRAGGTLLAVSARDPAAQGSGLVHVAEAALHAATHAMAAELAGRRIRVHALAPAATTGGAAAPLAHPALPADVGTLAAFLCSDAARERNGGVHCFADSP